MIDPTRPVKSLEYKGRKVWIVAYGQKLALTFARTGETPVFAVEYDDPNLVVEYFDERP